MKYYFILIAILAMSCRNNSTKKETEQASVIKQDTVVYAYEVEPSVPYHSANEERCKNENDLQEYRFRDSLVARQIAKRVLHSPEFKEYEYKKDCRMMLKVYRDTSIFITPLPKLEIPESAIGFCEIENKVFFIVGCADILFQSHGTKKRFGVKRIQPCPFDPPTWRFNIRQE